MCTASKLLWILQVVMEDIVSECCSSSSTGAAVSCADARRLGEELLHVFKLHQRVYELATGHKEKKQSGPVQVGGRVALVALYGQLLLHWRNCTRK
jgi:hypothetical protein